MVIAMQPTYLHLKAALRESEAKVLNRHATVAGDLNLWQVFQVRLGYFKVLTGIMTIVRELDGIVKEAEDAVTAGSGFDARFPDLLHNLKDLANSVENFYTASRKNPQMRRFHRLMSAHENVIQSLHALIHRLESKLALDRAYQGIFSEDESARSKAEVDLLNALFGAEPVAQNPLR